MLSLALCTITHHISASYNTAVRDLPDLYVCLIYTYAPQASAYMSGKSRVKAVIHTYYTLQRLTLQKVEGTSHGNGDCSEILYYMYLD